MVKEGILPQLIENAALQLGMPLGPLQLIDEVSIDLAMNISEQTKKAIGTNKLIFANNWRIKCLKANILSV